MGISDCLFSLNVSFVLTEHVSEPEREIFLHGKEGSFMSYSEPLVILENICEARAMTRDERRARALQGGLELLTEPSLEIKTKNLRE